MDKRYQVFISSTYEDLKEERLEVIQALLELNCMPAGMELFPAADDDQWTLIKQVIDDCDYYLVIVGGRYGSISADTGISYPQMEYEYAIEAGKPVISFTHNKPGSIPADKTERTDEGKKKLDEFRNLVRQKMCKSWETPVELGSVVSRSLIQLIKTKPAIGWVKADLVPDETASQEILKLRNKIKRLEDELKKNQNIIPVDSKNLSSGDDKLKIRYEVDIEIGNHQETVVRQDVNEVCFLTWNEIFYAIAPKMIWEETSEDIIINTIEAVIQEEERENIGNKHNWKDYGLMIHKVNMSRRGFDSIMIQFWALGYINKSNRPQHWTLAPFGLKVMLERQAIKKNNSEVPGDNDIPF